VLNYYFKLYDIKKLKWFKEIVKSNAEICDFVLTLTNNLFIIAQIIYKRIFVSHKIICCLYATYLLKLNNDYR
jgi:hypothetical protein